MDWKNRFAVTTVTSYLQMGLRIVTGLVMFRTMYTSWDEQEFGFWALLWSVLAFGILLDFGLGTTIQKTVASRVKEDDIDGVNRVVSTVFWTFAGIGAAIMLLAFLLRGALFAAVDVPASHLGRFVPAYFWFFAGVAFAFPFGIFGEVLAGVQRVDIQNITQIFSTLVNATCVLILLHRGAGIEQVMIWTTALGVVVALVNALLARRYLRGLSVHPRFFSLREVGSRLKFSLAAYLIIFSGIVLTKTDQAVLAGVIGLGAVTVYQAAVKVSEILNLFATQSENLISPAAAQLHSRGNRAGVIDLLFKNSRFLFILSTPCYILGAIYLDDLILLLTGLSQLPRETWVAGQMLLLAVYIGKVTSSCGRRVMVMCGMENRLLKLSLAQAAVNLVLSVVLAHIWGVSGVAAATLITSAVFGFGVFLPLLRKFAEVSLLEYLGHHLRGTTPALTVLAGLLALVTFAIPGGDTLGFFELTWRGLFIAIPYLACNLRLIRGTWAD